jgi:hypothetical protein
MDELADVAHTTLWMCGFVGRLVDSFLTENDGFHRGEGNDRRRRLRRLLKSSCFERSRLVALTVVNPHLDQPLTTEVVVHGASIANATGTVLSEPTFIHTTTSITLNAVHPHPATIGQPTAGRMLHHFGLTTRLFAKKQAAACSPTRHRRSRLKFTVTVVATSTGRPWST